MIRGDKLNKFVIFMLGCLLATNLLLVVLTSMLGEYILRHMVYDLDTVRADALKSIEYYYHDACMEGTDYPPEYRVTDSGWNPNSTTSWCHAKVQDRHNKFMEEIKRFGQ